MSDRLDAQIRELFAELDRVAPEAPPRPLTPARRPTSWTRVLVPAASVTIVVLVVGVLGLLLPRSDDSGETEAAADTIAAPATTEAMAEGGGDGASAGTRPTENVVVLVEVNLSCARYADSVDELGLKAPSTPEEYLAVVTSLSGPVADLAHDFEEIEAESSSLTGTADALRHLADSLATATLVNAEEVYKEARSELSSVSSALVDFGALDCEVLDTTLP